MDKKMDKQIMYGIDIPCMECHPSMKINEFSLHVHINMDTFQKPVVEQGLGFLHFYFVLVHIQDG